LICIIICDSVDFKKSELPFLIILNNKEEAAYYLNDLEQMIGDQDVLLSGSFVVLIK
jgi:transcription-repair coupling factor (superfamily II helicase)